MGLGWCYATFYIKFQFFYYLLISYVVCHFQCTFKLVRVLVIYSSSEKCLSWSRPLPFNEKLTIDFSWRRSARNIYALLNLRFFKLSLLTNESERLHATGLVFIILRLFKLEMVWQSKLIVSEHTFLHSFEKIGKVC